MHSLKKQDDQVPELKLDFDPYIDMIFMNLIVSHPEEKNVAPDIPASIVLSCQPPKALDHRAFGNISFNRPPHSA